MSNTKSKGLYLDIEGDIKLLITLDESHKPVVKLHTKNDLLLENLRKELNGELVNNKEIQYITIPIILDDTGRIYGEKLRLSFSIDNNSIKDISMEKKITSIKKTLLSQNTEYEVYMPKEDKYSSFERHHTNEKIVENQSVMTSKISENTLKTKTDLHNHYAGMLSPNRLIALGIKHDVDYNLGLIANLDLELTTEQKQDILQQLREKNAKLYEKLLKYEDTDKSFEILAKNIKNEYIHSKNILEGITIPFIDLIKEDNRENLNKIKESLRIGPDGQTAFTSLEKVYDARDPFTKGNGNGKYDKNPMMKNHLKELLKQSKVCQQKSEKW